MNRTIVFTALLIILSAPHAFATESEAVAAPLEPVKAQESVSQTVTAAEPQEKASVAIMATVKKSIDDSKAVIEAKDLKSVHPHTSKAMEALKSLLAAVAPAPEKKERLEAAIKQMNTRLDVLHDVADKNDVAKTDAELKKTEGAFKLLELQVGK